MIYLGASETSVYESFMAPSVAPTFYVMLTQGNTFYTLSFGHGTADTIRRVAAPSSAPASDTAVGGLEHGEDVPVYTGTGVILAMAVDADDNLVFSMEDAPAVSGGVYMLKMAPGGVLLLQDEDKDLGSGGEASLDDAAAPAVPVAAGLGPFLPGVAVCPVSGDIFVSRGHTGIARLVKDADGGFSTKVWLDASMSLVQLLFERVSST